MGRMVCTEPQCLYKGALLCGLSGLQAPQRKFIRSAKQNYFFCQHYCMVGKILSMWGILSKTLKSQIRRSLRLSLAIQEVTELARALSMHAYSFIYICICVYIIFLKLLKYHIHYTVFFILCLSLFLTHRVTRQSTSLIWVAAQKDEQTLPYSLC